MAALTLTKLPSARAVWPDPAGIARTETLDAEVLDVGASPSVRSRSGVDDDTSATFVVVRFAAPPHRDLALLEPRLHTAGGLTYWPVSRGDITSTISVPVGQPVIAAVVFEVHPELLAGATFTVVPHVVNGIVPVVRTPTFRLPDQVPTASEPPVLGASELEAGR